MTDVVRQIEDARRARKWTRAKLAEAADVDPGALSRILNGTAMNPRNDTIDRLCRALGLAAPGPAVPRSGSTREEYIALLGDKADPNAVAALRAAATPDPEPEIDYWRDRYARLVVLAQEIHGPRGIHSLRAAEAERATTPAVERKRAKR